MVNEQDWFLEKFEPAGTAFGLRLGEKLHSERSDFQEIEIYQTDTFGRLMVIDGAVMLTDRDNFLYHEMLTHPALCLHPQPKRVLIIGGGDCGTLREVLRHSVVEEVTQVEIDERVTRLAEEYFPDLCSSNQDPRAKLLFDDGIAHVKNAAEASLDLIIIDSTDPVGPAEGLFNRAFYKDCVRALSPNGMLVQQTESPMLHMSLIRSVHDSLQAEGFAETHLLHFPQPVYPSGWWSASLALKQGPRPEPVASRVEEVTSGSQYFNAGTLAGALALPNFVMEGLTRG